MTSKTTAIMYKVDRVWMIATAIARTRATTTTTMTMTTTTDGDAVAKARKKKIQASQRKRSGFFSESELERLHSLSLESVRRVVTESELESLANSINVDRVETALAYGAPAPVLATGDRVRKSCAACASS
jgi:hypothetical protein